MTERPQNARTTLVAERTHNSHRHAESDAPQAAARAYHGAHRAERMHRADDAGAGAVRRSSRVGRHHADQHGDRTGRW